MRSRLFIVSLFFIFLTFSVKAQGLFGDKIFVGGGIGSEGIILNTFNIYLGGNAHVGYKVTDRLSAGVRVRYIYDHFRQVDITLNHVGGGVFTQYIIARNIFAALEYERMTYEVPFGNDLNNTNRIGFDSMFLGAGYFQPLGGQTTFSMTAFYNLLYGDGTNSQYQSPFLFRAGFNVGF
jgi:hypothetical protein